MTENNIYKKLNIKDYNTKLDVLNDFLKAVDLMRHDDTIGSVSIYAKSEYICMLFKRLADNFEIGAIHLDSGIYDTEYNSVYCLSATDDKLMFIEPAYNNEGKPYHIMNGIVFMFEEECGQDLIDEALGNDVVTVLFGVDAEQKKQTAHPSPKEKEDDRDGSGWELRLLRGSKDDKVHGFVMEKEKDGCSWEYSYWGSEDVSPREIAHIIDRIFY